jgi:hypothetical protein
LLAPFVAILNEVSNEVRSLCKWICFTKLRIFKSRVYVYRYSRMTEADKLPHTQLPRITHLFSPVHLPVDAEEVRETRGGTWSVFHVSAWGTTRLLNGQCRSDDHVYTSCTLSSLRGSRQSLYAAACLAYCWSGALARRSSVHEANYWIWQITFFLQLKSILPSLRTRKHPSATLSTSAPS